ncbi:hypothetical protein AYO44_01515 [Planctomycetaceae bacterium SCGC AG-212-F19]|nr:hypothetical protein AYO44_01515 [Planctomycetaceae bacterium SCGC AG-212-F19]
MCRSLMMLLALLLIAADPVKLPMAREGKPIDPKATDILVLTLNHESVIAVPGRNEPLSTFAELQDYLKEQFATRQKQAGAGQVKTALVVRADTKAEVMALYHVAQLGAAVGFPRVFVQVLRTPKDEGRLELVVPHWRRPESFADITLLAKTIFDGVNDGNLAALIVQTDSGETAIANAEALEPYLKKQRTEGKVANPDCVRIAAEGKLHVGQLIAVLDVCLRSGFPSVTLAAPPELLAEAKAGSKRIPPGSALQAQAEKEIKAIYQALYSGKAPAELARRLRQAAEVCDEPAAKYVLLRESADAAGKAGNIVASMAALDQLTNDFTGDVWRLKLEQFKTAPGGKTTAEAALKQAGTAAALGRLDFAVRFFKLADNAAKETKDADLIQFVEERRLSLKLPRVDDLDPFAALPVTGTKTERPGTQKADAAAPAARPGEQEGSRSAWQGAFLWYVVPGIIVVIVVAAGLAWWLRRGDKDVRSRLAAVRKGQFTLPGAEEPPEPPGQGAGPGPVS